MSRLEEEAAREIVEAVRPDRRLRRLDLGGAQLADFEMVDRDDRRVGLLEVTTSTPGQRLSFDASLERFDWTNPALSCSWWVHVRSVDSANVPLRALHAGLAPILTSRDLADVDGVVEIDWWDLRSPQWHRDLDQLGVVWLQAFESGPGPHAIHIRKPNTGGALGWSLVNDAVTEEINKPDNLVKLRATEPGSITEIFVWLTDSTAQLTIDLAGAELLRGGGPATGVALPYGITGVWIASGTHDLTPLARSVYFADGNHWLAHSAPRRRS